ncbi:MAG: hypothetical protein IBX68_07905 [Dehalococcoidia bacterium]|nr:hypothetical protein [Dehalococcoidia bacterium]
MFAFNRALVTIIILFILAGAVITFLVVIQAVSPDIPPYSWMGLERAAEASGWSAVAIGAVSIIIALLVLFLLLLELRPKRAEKIDLVLDDSFEGRTTIDQDLVRELAERTGAAFAPEVKRLTCDIRKRRFGIAVYCNTLTSPAGDIPRIGAEIQRRVRHSIEKETGLSVREVRVEAAYDTGENVRRVA